MKSMNWKLFFRITWIMTVIGIIILSLLPPANMNYQLYGNDKIGHHFAYAILSLNSMLVFQRWPKWLLIYHDRLRHLPRIWPSAHPGPPTLYLRRPRQHHRRHARHHYLHQGQIRAFGEVKSIVYREIY